MREQTRLEMEMGQRHLAEIAGRMTPPPSDPMPTAPAVVEQAPAPAPEAVPVDPAPAVPVAPAEAPVVTEQPAAAAPDTPVKLAEPVEDTPEVAAKKRRVSNTKVESVTPDNMPQVTQ